MTKTVAISRLAYGKIFLHAAKYFDGILIGYVIGKKEGEGATVADVFPVCHSNPAGPILDIAGDTADKLYGDGDKIIGIYYATDSANPTQTPANVERIIEGVAATVGGECLVVKVCNNLLSAKDKLFVEVRTSKKAQCKCEMADPIAFISSMLDGLLIQKIHVTFVDFEDHLNSSADVGSKSATGAADFRNPIASNFIAHYTPTV